MVEEGKLPLNDTDDADEVIAAVVRAMQTGPREVPALSPEAVDHLLHAVDATGEREGSIRVTDFLDGLTIWSGNRRLLIGNTDKRGQAKHRQALKELVACGLLERLSADHLEVTQEGYLAADEIKVGQMRSQDGGRDAPPSPA
jgi:hypothetical protein